MGILAAYMVPHPPMIVPQVGRGSEKQIGELLDRAEELIFSPDIPRDGYYAYVCDRCAASFSYYGYFAAAQKLEKRAEEIRSSGS